MKISRDMMLIAKAVSWRAVGTLDTFVVSWWVTGQAQLALAISGVEFFSKIVLYYLHERAWLSTIKRV
jgi:uncharacterized membrane protein